MKIKELQFISSDHATRFSTDFSKGNCENKICNCGIYTYKIYFDIQDKFLLSQFYFFLLQTRRRVFSFLKFLDFQSYYQFLCRLYDVLLLSAIKTFLSFFQLLNDVLSHKNFYLYVGDLGNKLKYSLVNLFSYLLSNSGDFSRACHKTKVSFYNYILHCKKLCKNEQWIYDNFLHKILFYKINKFSLS